MRDLLLILAVLIMAVAGYLLMKKLGTLIEDNYWKVQNDLRKQIDKPIGRIDGKKKKRVV